MICTSDFQNDKICTICSQWNYCYQNCVNFDLFDSLELWQVALSLGPTLVILQVVFVGPSLSTNIASIGPVVGVDSKLVLLHLGFAHDSRPANVTNQLLRVLLHLILCTHTVVHSTDMMVQIGPVGELLRRAAFFLTNFTLPDADVLVHCLNVFFHSGSHGGTKRTIWEHAHPLASA